MALTDIAGHSDTGSRVLEPEGTPGGKVLVVYNPGLSGQLKDVAMTLGGQLVDEGYSVTVAGVKSDAAADIAGYDLVIVGGPIYGGGKCSSTIKQYLKAFSPAEQVKLAVFATTGNGDLLQSDLDSLNEQVDSLIGSKPNLVQTDVRLILIHGVEEDRGEMVRSLTSTT